MILLVALFPQNTLGHSWLQRAIFPLSLYKDLDFEEEEDGYTALAGGATPRY